MTADLIADADQLLAAGRTADALALVQAQAARSHPDALMRLATWHLIGAPLPRDLAAARAWLARAADAGHVDAALMQVALVANGSGAAADFAAARALLETAALRDPVAAAQLALVQAMALRPDGGPAALPAPLRLSPRHPVFRFPAFLTPAECRHLAESAAPLLEPSQVADPRTGQLMAHPVRTSSAATIGPTREDLAIRAINLRIAAASNTPVSHGEPLIVLHYGPGQQYRPHLDTLPNTPNQRGHSFLLYLNEGFGGGETAFPLLDLTVRPKAGDGLLFLNSTPDGRPITLSRHAGLPITQGAKWLATRWIRCQPLNLWSQ